jgi:hypothetical protein
MALQPFPGMDPYLEHQVLWPGVHTALMVEIRKQLAPKLRPRYITSLEERVFIEVPEHPRIPDVWIQATSEPGTHSGGGTAVAVETDVATPVLVDVDVLEIREPYLEILDLYREQRVVTVLELLSATNKKPGPGRDSYVRKQQATLASECNLVEIDLLREGERVFPVPEPYRRAMQGGDYVISVSRWPHRARLEMYPCRLRETLPKFGIPLAEPDPDVTLDLQAALDQVYQDAGYMLRVKYNEPCLPPLPDADQTWAHECWREYRQAHPELFGSASDQP